MNIASHHKKQAFFLQEEYEGLKAYSAATTELHSLCCTHHSTLADTEVVAMPTVFHAQAFFLVNHYLGIMVLDISATSEGRPSLLSYTLKKSSRKSKSGDGLGFKG